jgi:hypothetical protein
MKRTPQHGTRNPEQAGRGSVQFHIERLVVEGLPLTAADAARLQSTIERELGRLLARTSSASWNGGATRQRPAPPLHLAPGNSPGIWGRQIARSLFGSVIRPSKPASLAPEKKV